MSALPNCKTAQQGALRQQSNGTLRRNQLTQSRSVEISPSSFETSLAIAVISPLPVGEGGALDVAVVLFGGQEVTFNGNGAVENVVGSGGQPEFQRVR